MERPFFRFSIYEPMDSDVIQVFGKFYAPNGLNYVVSFADGQAQLKQLEEGAVITSDVKPVLELRFGYEANKVFLNCLKKSLDKFLNVEIESSSEIKGRLSATQENEFFLKDTLLKVMQKSGLINEVK